MKQKQKIKRGNQLVREKGGSGQVWGCTKAAADIRMAGRDPFPRQHVHPFKLSPEIPHTPLKGANAGHEKGRDHVSEGAEKGKVNPACDITGRACVR